MTYNNYKVAGNWKQYPQKRSYAPYNSGYGRSTGNGSGIKKAVLCIPESRKVKMKGIRRLMHGEKPVMV